MVGHTRGSPEGFGRETGSGSQQPPPPPPNLAELMAMQTEFLRQLVQGQQNPPRQQQRGGRDEQPAGYQEFFCTQPLLFSRSDEPLDADAWLRTIESKFALLAVPCADANKAQFAAQTASWHRSHLVGSLLCYAACWTCYLLGGIPECLEDTSYS